MDGLFFFFINIKIKCATEMICILTDLHSLFSDNLFSSCKCVFFFHLFVFLNDTNITFLPPCSSGSTLWGVIKLKRLKIFLFLILSFTKQAIAVCIITYFSIYLSLSTCLRLRDGAPALQLTVRPVYDHPYRLVSINNIFG